MAKYQITGPDGKTYDVNAPEGASEEDVMSFVQKQVEAGTASGGPDYAAQTAGMDPVDLSIARAKNDGMGNYLREQAQLPREGEVEEDRERRLHGSLAAQERAGAGEGSARGFVQGATFGAGDELVAAGAAGLDSLINDEDFGEAYDYRVGRERDKIDQFRDDSPVLAYGSEIAGSIPTAMLPGVRGPQAASALGKVLARGATGGTQGAVYGFNAGEGDAADRAKNAVVPGAAGTVLGAASVPVVAGVKNIANRYLTNRAAKEVGTSGPAYRILERTMSGDDSLSGAGAGRLAAAGDDAMLADAGPNARGLLDTAIQNSGPGARQAREAVEGRVTDAGRRLTGTLDDTFGAPQGVRTAAKGIAQGTSAARKSAYDSAYSKAIDYASDAGRNIEATLSRIPDRIMGKAVQGANERMQAGGFQNQQIMANIADDGTVTFTEMPNVLQLDYIKRALGEMGAEAVDQFGRKTGDGIMFSKLARDIKKAIGDAVPEYLQAVKLGGDKIERDAALRLGYTLLNTRTTREEVAEIAADMSDEARQAAMQGLRSQIDDALANVKRALTDDNMDAREAIKLIKDMSSRASREKVAMIIGDDAANALFRDVDKASMAFNLRAGVADNSRTFARTATAEGIKDHTEAGAINAVRSGQPLNAGKRLASTLMGRSPEAKERISDEVYSHLVQALTGPRGSHARNSLQRMQQVGPRVAAGTQKTQLLADALMQRNPIIAAQGIEASRR
jgi:hypothetical protein